MTVFYVPLCFYYSVCQICTIVTCLLYINSCPFCTVLIFVYMNSRLCLIVYSVLSRYHVKTVWHLLKTMCYGPLAIHATCKYDLICATLYTFFVLVHNTSGKNNPLFATSDLQRTLFEHAFFLWRLKEEESKDLHFPLHCDGELWRRMCAVLSVCPSVCRRTIDSGPGTHIRTPPGWQVSQQTSGEVKGRLLASRPPLPLRLWLTVAYFDPLSDE